MEIKFRGKQTESGEWYHGYYVKDRHGGHHILSEYNGLATITHSVDGDTVGMCTGLKDKNGAEIFVGDIVKRSFGVGYSTTRYPSYENGTERVSVGEVAYDCESAKYRFLEQPSDPNFIIHIEVIGNTHDNPELLREAA